METSFTYHGWWDPLYALLIHDKRQYFFHLSSFLLYPFLSFFWRICQPVASQSDGLRHHASRTEYGALDLCRITGSPCGTSAARVARLFWPGMAWYIRRPRLVLDPLPARGIKIPASRFGCHSVLSILRCDL